MGWEHALDRWLTTPPEPKEIVVGTCEECGDHIMQGDEIYDTVDGQVHEDCFVDFAKRVLEARKIDAE